MADLNPTNLRVTLTETRSFPPSADFIKKSAYSSEAIDAMRAQPTEQYWADAAHELEWSVPFREVVRWTPPRAQWFLSGKLNASVNCLDRHLKRRGQKPAMIWEGEPGEVVTWTYAELTDQVVRFAAVLRSLGLQVGDTVAIYMPMVPESVVAMLACARLGITHTVVFGGFASNALVDRIQDCDAKAVITADWGYRKGAQVPLRNQVEAAVQSCPSIQHVIVAERSKSGNKKWVKTDLKLKPANPAPGQPTEYFLWSALMSALTDEEIATRGTPELVVSEHPLFILYTSGTTGKPKGIVHSTSGYLTGVLRTFKQVFDWHESDIYWCTADIGWITGHSYVVYGPLAAGATIFMYEGAPTYPQGDRFWSMIARHKITILYTAPTAIRALMRLGDELPARHNLTSLRLLGSVGEPINPEAWMWYREKIGGSRCPIVDTYWQTETGAIVVSPLPGITATKPGSATTPLPGYEVDVLDQKGNPVPLGSGGYLVIKKPWPSMARTIHGNFERFKAAYFSEYPNGIYFTGDGARRDEDGYIWCLGRVDDVLNVSGHRLGTMEVESSIASHPLVAEAAVVGRPDDLKGQAIVAFVTLKADVARDYGTDAVRLTELKAELKAHVAKEIGALARPDDIRLTDSLPKTRSGKIMRRLLREIAAGGAVNGDTTTLEDLSTIAALQKDEAN